MIAFAAALIAYRWPRFELPFANVSALFYTIPSIALFQIMVPITGHRLADASRSRWSPTRC